MPRISKKGALSSRRRNTKPDAKSKKKLTDKSASASASSAPIRPVFGVPLDVAFARDPSHDGVPLPAFFRQCIDYVELHGLSTEGLYRVPGVTSHVQTLITHLDNGVPFPQIPPTSPNYKPPQATTQVAPSSVVAASSVHRLHGATDKRSISLTVTPTPPHDITVVTSVIKHFLRSLPDPVLSQTLRAQLESLLVDSSKPVHRSIVQLIHQELPRSHRFLLAWLLQHFGRVIDRAGENLMNLSNLSVILSPCLEMSHQLLAVLLRPAPADFHIDLSQLDSTLAPVDPTAPEIVDLHWLFQHPDYLLRPYHPPLRITDDQDLPESDAEVEAELAKQKSLLSHLHHLLSQGEVSPETDRFVWETQRVVTELKRRKSLNSPTKIRAELNRQQIELDRLYQMMISQPDASINSSSGTRRRSHHTSDKSGRANSTLPSSYTSPIFDELLSVQRHVTMLKRRLKQMETGQQAQQPISKQTLPMADIPLANTGSAGLSFQTGSIPLVIPTLAELDEEEVLNLALRKLPPITQTASAATAEDLNAVPVQMPPPDVRLQPPPSTSLAADELQVDLYHSPKPQLPKTIQLAVVSAYEPMARVSLSAASPVVTPSTSHVLQLGSAGDATQMIPSGPQSLQTTKSEASSPESRSLAHVQSTPTVLVHSQIKKPESSHLADLLEFHAARKQEMEAVQTDLLSRIDSERAEINRIQSQIFSLLKTGDQQLKDVYEEATNTALLAWATTNTASESTFLLPTAVSDKPWTRLADECQRVFSDRSAKRYTERRINDRSDSSMDGDDQISENDSSIDEDDPAAKNASFVAYTRLTEDEETTDLGASCQADDNTEKADANDVDEFELARTLYQLILENARVERSNCRYLEDILAERNQCTELKVRLKLRTSATPSCPIAPVPSAPGLPATKAT